MPFSHTALAECLSLQLYDLGPGGKNSNSFFCVLFCLIYPGCTHYRASLGNGNELCGSPGVSQSDLQYVSVSLIKSGPWFSSWDFCEPSSPFWALWCKRRPLSDICSQVLLWIWSFAFLMHHRSLTGYPFHTWHQCALAVCICSFAKPVRKEVACLSQGISIKP